MNLQKGIPQGESPFIIPNQLACLNNTFTFVDAPFYFPLTIFFRTFPTPLPVQIGTY